jgi:hypothetical protein
MIKLEKINLNIHPCSYEVFVDGIHIYMPIPVTARSKAWVCGRSLAGIVGSNPTGGMDVCRECCVLSGRGLCVRLITRPEECGVSVISKSL